MGTLRGKEIKKSNPIQLQTGTVWGTNREGEGEGKGMGSCNVILDFDPNLEGTKQDKNDRLFLCSR